MNKEQLTEKLNEVFEKELCYKPKFEVIKCEDGIIFPNYKTVFLKWRHRVEYWELQVIAKYFDDNPWIEVLDEEYLLVIFSHIEEAQN